MKLRENVPLAELTTMRLGGPARFVIEAETEDDVREAYDFALEKRLPLYPLGSGANSLGLDFGFPGIILLNRLKGFEILNQSKTRLLVKAFGGEIWDDFVAFTCQKGFADLAVLSKIPGTVGAAPVQNIGAYGGEAKDTLKSVSVYDSLLDEFRELAADDCDFAYRHSIFNSGETKGRYFILSATFELTKPSLAPPFYNSLQAYLDAHGISDYSPDNLRAAVSEIRKEKLPDPETTPSAGSFFKNLYAPASEKARLEALGLSLRETADGTYKLNVAQVLELSGLKGKVFHGFEISEKAPLVLINRSGTSYADLEAAVLEITKIVREKFGLTLEPEPVPIRDSASSEEPARA
ncbi:UDP-N-acetylmuramate dehydrogenase [Candidatus Saccharibacteria bacterium]|nr:UDP-N-acetylmuramate dehydrogenase [Candidatus Saccharibacteria bacterium]